VNLFLLVLDENKVYNRSPSGNIVPEGFRLNKEAKMQKVKKGLFYAVVILTVVSTCGILYAGTAPSVELLSPKRGEEISFGDEVVVALSLYDPDGDIDITTIEFEVDNVDVIRNANTSAFLVTYSAKETTRAGRHTISFSIKDREGNVSELESYFNRAPEPKRERKFSYNGTVGVGGDYDKEASQSAIGRFKLNMYGGVIETIDYSLAIDATNEEASDKQRVSTFRLDLLSLYGGFTLGDATPAFTDYSIDGMEVFGIHAYPQLGFFGLEFLYGRILRDVEDPATFKQNIIGGKLKLGNKKKFQWGLALLKVRDDKDSLSEAIAALPDNPAPRDNIVIGTDITASFLNGKIRFTGEANESLLNEDITEGPGLAEDTDIDLPLDEDKWEWLFIINEHIVPILPGFTSLAAKAGIKIGPFYDNIFNAEYSYVGPSYFSLGNSAIINDRAGFRVWDSLWLMNRMLFINAAYQNYKNNLQDTLTNTTKNIGYSGSVYVYPIDFLSVNAGADIFTVSNGSDDPAEGVDTVNTTITGGAAYNMDIYITNSDVYFNGTASLYKDKVTAANSADTYSTRIGAISYFNDFPLDTKAVIGFDFGDLPNSLYLEARGGYRLLKDETLYPYADLIYETGPEQFDITVGASYDAPYQITVDGELELITSPDITDLLISVFAKKEF